MSTAEFDDARARLLLSNERLDVEETDIDPGEGYSSKRPSAVSQWGFTARAARLENLFRLLARDPFAQGATPPGTDSGV